MTLDIEKSCPFGSECETIGPSRKDPSKQVIHRCQGWQLLRGKDPQSQKEYDEWGCTLFEWLPVLLIEVAQTNRQQTATEESFRNEVVSTQGQFNKMLSLITGVFVSHAQKSVEIPR